MMMKAEVSPFRPGFCLSPLSLIAMHKKKKSSVQAAIVQIKKDEQESLAPARRLILLRHAHSTSSQQHPSLKDHDRPLSKVGRTDAAKLSKKLEHMGWIPQLILSSDAARTRETLKIMQDHVRALLDAIVYFIPSFYSISAMDGQTAHHLQQVICEHARDPNIHTVMADYNPHQYLWEPDFTLAGRKYQRQDLELTNARGNTLQCTHYTPSPIPQDTPLPCVIYCHGNSGCRADANEAAAMLLPSNITVFTLDFSGSGLSDGEYVSLGWHEKDDLKIVVSYLRCNKQVSCIGLWGRSMGAVTSLLYGAEDPSIAGMVLDSAFSNLFDLMMELVDVYKIRLPKFTVKMAVQYMRRVIQKKAKFDIMNLNCIKAAPKTFITALFGHASEDIFIQPHHSDLIFKSYAGDKNIIKFDGDHNSPRPQFYYDSVSIFFYNVLHPPQVSCSLSSKLEKYYDLGGLKIGSGMDESLLYEIVSGLRAVDAGATSSSSAPSSVSAAKSVSEFLSEIAPLATTLDSIIDQDGSSTLMDGTDAECSSHLQVNTNEQNEECCSYSSSNRESWGRCSSIGGSDEESSSTDCRGGTNSKHQMSLKALATPLRKMQKKSRKKSGNDDSRKSSRREKFEKLEGLSQRLRLCILKGVKHRRHQSS